MNRQDYAQLLGERSALQRMISETPLEDVLDRGSLTARLEEIEHCLSDGKVDEREPARARLTFNGRPVVGSYGIFADFGTKAISAFNEAVTAVAASLAGGLAAKGPIPNREQHHLLITNTALGSFGFELEEYRSGQLPIDEKSTLDQAIECTQNLLQGSVNSDDELLADSASELDQRALDKVRDFVSTLAENEAICALQFRNQLFRFTDVGQVRHSLERISRDNLHEEEQVLRGEFQGVLPKRRTFELQIGGTDQIITGKIAPAVGDADEINNHLHHEVEIRVMVTRVGNGRPRYLLLAMPEWREQALNH
ncbi:MAG: hypothetical protein Q8O37_05495 [Sulfuricellaceae bacterium]|nr:hypothetical protein [Sulfuricellaceae bacterium]